ncbi:hypothetical protein AA0473_1728 [Acetobacter orleanensis NRIC 0473]|nr:hypothetical protein AA0473_1728 [Acetobacter orleanensis NRIC 0473]
MGSSYKSTYVWRGGGDKGNWADPKNWTYYGPDGTPAGTLAPSATDSVIFPTGKNVTLAQSSDGVTNLTYASLTVENGASLTFPSYGTVTVNALVSNNGTLDAGTCTSIEFKQVITGNGILNNLSNVAIQLDATSSFSQINITGSGTLTASKDLKANTVSVTGNGSVVVDGNLLVSGKLTVASTVTVKGDIELGQPGSKETVLELKDGQNLTAGNGLSVNGTYVTQDKVYTASGVFAPSYMNSGVTIACFLTGSMIRTTDGDIAVEDIRVGDQLVTLAPENGANVTQPVIWVGKAHARVRPELPDDEAGWPVRVLKDAISDGVPYKDMLITAEHCLFFRGSFMPVRMLVNNVSIFYDKSITGYDYYHVETSQHAVMMADGVLTESYLDTNNRGSFAQTGSVATLSTGRRTWMQHGAAPLTVARENVEPIFHALMARAVTHDFPDAVHRPELTTDANLHLETMDGKIIRKIREENGRVSFMLPAGVTQVRLVSRASRPSDVVGPFVDDRRMLGVLVGDIVVQNGNLAPYHVMLHPESGSLPGWYAASPGETRWTNGSALLPLPTAQPQALRILTLHILSAGPYLLQGEASHLQSRVSG